jgi:hypothetical protein
MALETIIWLVLIIIIGLVIWKVTKSIMKAVFLAISAGVLILIIFGGLVIADAKDFKENFPTQPSLYLYEVDNKFISGFAGVIGEEFTPSFISKENLDSYDADDLESVLASNYKLFIVKEQALDTVETVGKDEDIVLTKQEVDDLLASDSPIDDYIVLQLGDISESQKALARKQVNEGMKIESDAEFRGFLFATLFSTAVEQEGPLFVFDQYKEGNIIVYKETALFKFMKKMPVSLVSKFVKVEEVE